MPESPHGRDDLPAQDEPQARTPAQAPGRGADRKPRHPPRPRELEDEQDRDQDDDEKPRKRRRWRFWAIIIGAALVIGGVAAWLFLPWRTTVSTDDAFIDAHVIQVSPRVSGRVLEVLVNDNQLVEEGDVLVRLDTADYKAKTQQARAAVNVAQAQVTAAQARRQQASADVAAAQAEFNLAQTNLSRYENLSAGVISEQQRDIAVATQKSAQARLAAAQRTVSAAEADIEQARAQVKQAQAALDTAQLQESYTTITAPGPGRVTNRAVQPGDYVKEGQQLLSLVPRDVFVTANFKETQLMNMHAGQPATIEIDAYPDAKFEGRVDSIQAGSGAAFSLLPPENATGNYVKVVQRVPVKIVFDQVPDPARYVLGPGMSVKPTVKVK